MVVARVTMRQIEGSKIEYYLILPSVFIYTSVGNRRQRFCLHEEKNEAGASMHWMDSTSRVKAQENQLVMYLSVAPSFTDVISTCLHFDMKSQVLHKHMSM